MLLFISVLFSLLLAELQPIVLLPPRKVGGMSLLTALKNRKSDREFAKDDLRSQDLSDLLWAAGGVNREGMIIL
jgi:hypothetical protein